MLALEAFTKTWVIFRGRAISQGTQRGCQAGLHFPQTESHHCCLYKVELKALQAAQSEQGFSKGHRCWLKSSAESFLFLESCSGAVLFL